MVNDVIMQEGAGVPHLAYQGYPPLQGHGGGVCHLEQGEDVLWLAIILIYFSVL